jgi:hypothetical protein
MREFEERKVHSLVMPVESRTDHPALHITLNTDLPSSLRFSEASPFTPFSFRFMMLHLPLGEGLF